MSARRCASIRSRREKDGHIDVFLIFRCRATSISRDDAFEFYPDIDVERWAASFLRCSPRQTHMSTSQKAAAFALLVLAPLALLKAYSLYTTRPSQRTCCGPGCRSAALSDVDAHYDGNYFHWQQRLALKKARRTDWTQVYGIKPSDVVLDLARAAAPSSRRSKAARLAVSPSNTAVPHAPTCSEATLPSAFINILRRCQTRAWTSW